MIPDGSETQVSPEKGGCIYGPPKPLWSVYYGDKHCKYYSTVPPLIRLDLEVLFASGSTPPNTGFDPESATLFFF